MLRSTPAVGRTLPTAYEPIEATAFGSELAWDTTVGPTPAEFDNYAQASTGALANVLAASNPVTEPFRLGVFSWRASDVAFPDDHEGYSREWADHLLESMAGQIERWGMGDAATLTAAVNWDQVVHEVTSTDFSLADMVASPQNDVSKFYTVRDECLEVFDCDFAMIFMAIGRENPDANGDGTWQTANYARGGQGVLEVSMASARLRPSDFNDEANRNQTWTEPDHGLNAATLAGTGTSSNNNPYHRWWMSVQAHSLRLHEFAHAVGAMHQMRPVGSSWRDALGGGVPDATQVAQLGPWSAMCALTSPLFRGVKPEGYSMDLIDRPGFSATLTSSARTGPQTWQFAGTYANPDGLDPVGVCLRTQVVVGGGDYDDRYHVAEVDTVNKTWTCTVVEDEESASWGQIQFLSISGWPAHSQLLTPWEPLSNV